MATGNAGKAELSRDGIRTANARARAHAGLAARIAQYSGAWKPRPPQVATNWFDWSDWGRLPR